MSTQRVSHHSRSRSGLAVLAVAAFATGRHPVVSSVLAVLAMGGTTHGAILFDNSNGLAQAIAASGTSTVVATPHGVTFTVGSNAMTLTSVVFGLYANAAGDGTVGVRLYAGQNALGTALQELAATTVTFETIANGGNQQSFNLGTGWTLDANTQYTVAVFGSSGTVTPRQGLSALASSSWVSNGLTFDQFTVGSSAAATGVNYWVQLNGTVSVIPGTGVAGLAALGLAGVARRRRR